MQHKACLQVRNAFSLFSCKIRFVVVYSSRVLHWGDANVDADDEYDVAMDAGDTVMDVFGK